MVTSLKFLIILILYILIGFGLVSCQNPSSQGFFYGSMGGTRKLIIASSAATITPPHTVAQYSSDGQFERVLMDLTLDNRTPRGLVMLSPFEFLLSTDTVDGILKYSFFNGASTWVSNANLNGVIGEIIRVNSGDVFVIEGTNIESFDANGIRIGNPRINTTTGSCVLNGVVKGLVINSSGYLVTSGQGNDDLLIYNVSDRANTVCVTANQTLGNVDPAAIVAHSDGHLYVATSAGTTDAILKFNGDGTGSAMTIFSNIAVISNPTAMVELPDGTLLVASDATNNIVRLDTSGNVLNNPFIQDVFTSYVQSMAVTREP